MIVLEFLKNSNNNSNRRKLRCVLMIAIALMLCRFLYDFVAFLRL